MLHERPMFLAGPSISHTRNISDMDEDTSSKPALKSRILRARRKRSAILRHREPSVQVDEVESFLNSSNVSSFLSYAELGAFMNSLTDLLMNTFPHQLNDPDFFELLCKKMLEVLRCDYECIRAVAFKVLRLSLFQQKNLVFLLTNHVDMYMIRALDVRVGNLRERESAFRLLCRSLEVYHDSPELRNLISEARSDKTKTQYAFPKSVMQPIIAIALRELNRTPATKQENDPLALPCIGLFLELAVTERDFILEMAGTDWIVKALTGTCSVSPGVSTLVSRVLVDWLDDPQMRKSAHLNLVLEQIFAPLIEYGFFQTSNVEGGIFRSDNQPLELPLDKYLHAFLSILRSWSGLFSCAAVNKDGDIGHGSPLRLLEFLGLGSVINRNLLKIRDMVVDICCEFVNLPYASNRFTTWDDALTFYGTMSTPDEYSRSLRDDFVLAETELLPYAYELDANEHMDMLTSFRALATFILISAGLPQSLARLIVAHPDDSASLKATLLLADLTYMSSSFLPSEWAGMVLSLPTLVQSACESISMSDAAMSVNNIFNGESSDATFQNESNAMMVLHRMDELLRSNVTRRQMPISPVGNYALFVTSDKSSYLEDMASSTSQSLSSLLSDAIGSSSTLEPSWNQAHMALSLIVKEFESKSMKSNVDKIYTLVDKVLNWLRPSDMRLKQSDPLHRLQAHVGKLSVRCCLGFSNDPHFLDVLLRYAQDCSVNLQAESYQTGVFSVKNMTLNPFYLYFAPISELSTHPKGIEILTRSTVFQQLHQLMGEECAPELVKLIVASLDYSIPSSMARLILNKALTSTNQKTRVWCTRWLGHLSTLNIKDFGQWGLARMASQLGDPSPKVVRHAIRLLYQHAPNYKDSVCVLRSANLDSFGEAGVLLRALLYSSEKAVAFDKRNVATAVQLWMKTFNARYVEAVEEDMQRVLLKVGRAGNGRFSRPSSDKNDRFGVRAPPHLLGELAKHKRGRQILIDENVAEQLFECMYSPEVNRIKGAAIALAFLTKEDPSLVPISTGAMLCRLAEEHEILSVRGVAYWALCILGSTQAGARILAGLGWESTRHLSVVEEMRLANKERTNTAHSNVVPIITQSGRRSVSGSVSECSRACSPLVRSRSVSLHANATPASPPPSLSDTRQGSAPAVYPEYTNSLTIEEPLSPRGERTFTVESVMTSGLGSLNEDGRRRAFSTVDDEVRSRSSTLQTQTSGGRSQLEIALENAAACCSREEHFSSRTRQRWRLCPLRMRKYLEVFRNVGDPVRYMFMSKEDIEQLTSYRNEVYGISPVASGYMDTSFPQPLTFISMPAHVNIICRGIFPSYTRESSSLMLADDLEDRGAKGGYGRVRREHVKPHNKHRCFYCTRTSKGTEFKVGPDGGSLRIQVLTQIDLLEIKNALPERKLLKLRKEHEWLFCWPCLYADVLEMLDLYRFKDASRTFLQHIFYGALQL